MNKKDMDAIAQVKDESVANKLMEYALNSQAKEDMNKISQLKDEKAASKLMDISTDVDLFEQTKQFTDSEANEVTKKNK